MLTVKAPGGDEDEDIPTQDMGPGIEQDAWEYSEKRHMPDRPEHGPGAGVPSTPGGGDDQDFDIELE